MARTLYVIDTYAQIFRAFYAIRAGMRSPVTGEPTQAVFGFTAMLIKLLRELKPDYVAAAVDGPGKTFRDEIFGEYKANRDETPQELTTQIPRVFDLLEAFGIPVVAHPGLEADDVIACIVRKVLDDPECGDVRIRIVSKDKDLEQLLSERVTMYDIHTDTETDVKALFEKKGITPQQVVDVLALMGDPVDNVPGVAGIGPKTAAKLISEYGSIEGIFARIDEIKGKKREDLEAARDVLALSRKLVTLKDDADINFSLEQARVRPLNLSRVLPLFQQLGFRRFLEDVRKLAGEKGAAGSADGNGTEELSAVGGASAGEAGGAGARGAEGAAVYAGTAAVATQARHAPPRGEYRLILTAAGLEDLVAELRKAPLISVDTETTGLGRDADLCGISLAWKEGHGVYIPVRSPSPGAHLSEAQVVEALRGVLEDESIPKCGHNLKFDAHALRRCGVRLRGIRFDSMLASLLIDPGQSGHKLDHLAQHYLNYSMIPISDLIGQDGTERGMDCVPLDQIGPYAAEDADIALRLHRELAPKLDELGMGPLLRDVEAPLIEVLVEMEANGVLCDPEELRRQGKVLAQRVEELKAQIFEIAGTTFNLDSPKQLAEVLFERLGLPAGKKTKTGYSTDMEVLGNLASQEDPSDPRTSVPRLLLEYRQLAKLINTYLDNLVESINPKTGRIHTTFHQLVTATGRLASQGPNLQNIPVRTEVGRQIRKAFVAPPGHLLLCADYSQIELRILAHLSGDEGLIDVFQKDLDIHAAVAAQVFGVPIDQVTREQRTHAKTINFGIIYGVTPYGLARRIEGLDVAQAAALIQSYKERYPGIDAFLQRCIDQALEYGYVTTILGRRRAIPELKSRNRAKRSLGERLAINSVVQGSAADLIKVAMVNIFRRIEKERLPLKMLLQIHDELVFETPAEMADEHAAIVRDEMERAMKLKVPLKAEAGAGPDWMTAK